MKSYILDLIFNEEETEELVKIVNELNELNGTNYSIETYLLFCSGDNLKQVIFDCLNLDLRISRYGKELKKN